MTGGGAPQERAALLAQLKAELEQAPRERRAQILRELERLGESSTVIAPPKETR